MRLALTPINPTVGDLAGNADLVIAAIRSARAAGADLVVTPELVISGYPPRDLLWQEGFVEAAMAQMERVAPSADGVVAIVGCPWKEPNTGAIRNSLLVVRDGRIVDRYDKRLLPTYDVFDEDRYFTPADRAVVISLAGRLVGLAICEDLWRGDDAGFSSRYRGRPDPVTELVDAGADLIVSPSASPFVLGKSRAQRDILAGHVQRHGVTLASLNQLGANDELIFNGQAAVLTPGPNGRPTTLASTAPFSGAGVVIDLEAASAVKPGRNEGEPAQEDLLWRALTLGVRDYVRKTGFADVVLGVSGGIDSAVVASIAAGALGAEHVLTIGMPSRHSSAGSITDAQRLAGALDVRFEQAPIHALHAQAESTLVPIFHSLRADEAPGAAEENIQARLRGMILMALSNKLGALLLTTANKSELAVGYCTLYGDMSGGLAVLSDVSKTQVYALARWINKQHHACGFASAPIPVATIDKPPSAELKDDQTDQDSLPPYDALDEIIARYIEHRQSPSRIVAETGLDAGVVALTIAMIDRSEYKRKQATIGLKATSVAFGSGRRYPIAQRWRPV